MSGRSVVYKICLVLMAAWTLLVGGNFLHGLYTVYTIDRHGGSPGVGAGVGLGLLGIISFAVWLFPVVILAIIALLTKPPKEP